MAGLGDKVEGKAKELQGEITDDDAKKVEGEAQQARGEVKDAAADIRAEVKD